MDSIVLEILIILVLCSINGFLAMSELAVVSANRGELSSLAQKGNRRAEMALRLSSDSANFLATVQIGITIVGIVAGVFGGATIAEDVSHFLQLLGVSTGKADPTGYVVVVGGITYLSVVFGELVPKQLALSRAEMIAMLVAPTLDRAARWCRPIVWLLERSSTLVLRMLPFPVVSRPEVCEADIRRILAQGAEVGEILPEERDISLRALRLADRPIRAFMTPRVDMSWIDITSPFELIVQKVISAPHSFFPASAGGLEKLLGIISLKDVMTAQGLGSGRPPLESLVRPALRIPSSRDALSVLREFKSKRTQLALIVDDHDSVCGMVTTHDLLEALVGDLPDFEGERLSMVPRGDGSYLVDAGVDVQELLMAFGNTGSLDSGSVEFHSVGGVIFSSLRSVPTIGSKVTWKDLIFEVVEMDSYRIVKVLVSPLVVSAPPLSSSEAQSKSSGPSEDETAVTTAPVSTNNDAT